MTAGTVVITGGILATVILLCIIAVLCYCRLQVRPSTQFCSHRNQIAALFALSCLCFALLYVFLSRSTVTLAFVAAVMYCLFFP